MQTAQVTTIALVLSACSPGGHTAEAAPQTTQEPAQVSQQTSDSVVTAVIPPEGGSVELAGIVEVVFPSGAFDSARTVAIEITQSEKKDEVFRRKARNALRLPYEVRIRTGSESRPAVDLEANFRVPEEFVDNLPPDHAVVLWIQYLQTGGLEVLYNFQIFPSEFDAGGHILRAVIPKGSFTYVDRVEPVYESVCIVAGTRVLQN